MIIFIRQIEQYFIYKITDWDYNLIILSQKFLLVIIDQITPRGPLVNVKTVSILLYYC